MRFNAQVVDQNVISQLETELQKLTKSITFEDLRRQIALKLVHIRPLMYIL